MACEKLQTKKIKNRHLLPIWKAIGYKELVDNYFYTFDTAILPEYGGSGVNIVFDDNDKTINCERIKIENDSQFLSYCAKDYCLPFTSPNKIPYLSDPCLKVIQRFLKNQDTFCNRLMWYRYHTKTPKTLPVLEKCYENLKLLTEGNYQHDLLKIPKHIMNLLKFYPDPFPTLTSNWLYTGGCLSLGPELTLSYLSGPRTENIASAKLEENNVENRTSFGIKNIITFPFNDNNKIHQIAHQETMKRNFCAVRKKCKFDVFSIVEKDDTLKFDLLATNHSAELLSSIAISPHIPGEILTSTHCGYIQLQSLNTNDIVWKTEKELVHESSNDLANDWWVADFGACPRSLLYHDRTNLIKIDLRTKKINSQVLLSQSSPFLHGEELMVHKRSLLNNLQYFVACSNHLALIDERFAQKPIHLWNHQLETVPLYCTQTIIENDNQLLLCLASQNSKQTSCLQLDSKSEMIQPISLGSMWHSASPGDFIKMMRLQGEFFSTEIQMRTSLPVIGIEAIPHSKDSGFTVFHLTSVGDLYYQDYIPDSGVQKEKTFCYGSGCEFLNRESSLSKCSDWVTEAFVKIRPSDEDSVTEMNFNILNAYDLLFSGPNSSDTCPVCFENSKLSNSSERNVCPGCGLDENAAFKILKVKEMGGIISKYDYLNEAEKPKLNLIDLNQKYDPLSMKLLSVWLDQDKSEYQSDNVDQEDERLFASLLHPSTPSQQADITNEMVTPPNTNSFEEHIELSNTMELSSLVQTSKVEPDIKSLTILDMSSTKRELLSDDELLETPKRVKRKINIRKFNSSVGF